MGDNGSTYLTASSPADLLMSTTTGATVYAVCKPARGAGNQNIIASTQYTVRCTVNANGGQIRNAANTAWDNVTDTIETGGQGPCIVRFRLAAGGGGTSGVRAGRNAEATSSPASVYASASDVGVLARAAGGDYFDGTVARILFYDAEVSAADDAAIMAELERLYLPTLVDLIPGIGFVIDPWADHIRDGYTAPHIRDAGGVYAMTKTAGSGAHAYDAAMGGVAWKNTDADYIHAYPYSLANADHDNQDAEIIALSQGTTTGVDHIVNAREGSDQGWQLYYGASDNCVFQAEDAGTATLITIFVATASDAGTAHAHRVTFDNGTGAWELFEDGVSEDSTTEANHAGGDFSGQDIQYGHRAGGFNTQALGPMVYCAKAGGFTAAERTTISNYLAARWSGYGGSL